MKIIVAVTVFAMLLIILTGIANAATFFVPDDYSSINDAIRASSPGDTIIVRSGTYYENVLLNKSLSLIGEGLPTIDAQNRGSAITITADNCTVSGFRFVKTQRNSRCAGMKIYSNWNIIENNICEYTFIGIHLLNSLGNKILNNSFKRSFEGIRLQNSRRNKILKNTFKDCGLFLLASYGNDVEGNTVNGKPLVYLENVSGAEIKNAGQVILVNSDGIIVRNCDISRTTIGIQLLNSFNCTIRDNKLRENYFGIGISLSNSSNNKILNNTLEENRRGLYLLHSSMNMIVNNSFRDCGLYVVKSYGNDVEGNTVNGKPLVYLENVSGAEIKNAGQVILVNSDGIIVRNCDISRTTIGIQLLNSFNCTIRDNKLRENYFGIGISLSNSSNNKILNNTLEENNRNINLLYSSGNEITNNTFCGSDLKVVIGIYMLSSSGNRIMRNTFRDCGLYVVKSYGNDVEGNTVNGKPLVYLENVSGAEIKNAGQVILVNCESVTIKDCNISHTTVGIYLWKSSNCTIEGNKVFENLWGGISLWGSSKNKILNNTCEKNDDGIHLTHSSRNKILNNKVSDNDFFGISLWLSQRNRISRNSIRDNNFFGIYLRYSSNNKIFLNDIVNNSPNVYSINSNNFWNSTRPITYIYNNRTYRNYMGNYWGNYPGEEADDDGIGDTPYKVNGNDYDYYPLIQPLKFYSRRSGSPIGEIRDVMKRKHGGGGFWR